VSEHDDPDAAYVAVYVAAVVGAVMMCVCAPPSDQLVNVYVRPPSACGDVAETEFVDP
jgi:hypothetical protein